MIFEHDDETMRLIERVQRFMDAHVYPNVETYVRQEHEGERWKAVRPESCSPSAMPPQASRMTTADRPGAP